MKAPPEFATADHWLRVEFAAKCTQVVLPLMSAVWPDCPQERADALNQSTILMLEAAQSRTIPPALSKVSLACRVCAGIVLRPLFPNGPQTDEPLPATHENCRIAHLIANSAANATDCVESSESAAWYAFQAYGFARDAAVATRNLETGKRLEELRSEYFPDYG